MTIHNYFEYEIARSLRMMEARSNTTVILGQGTIPFVWWRIPDTKLLRFMANSESVTANTVPADFLFISQGRCYFIECKSSRSTTSYKLDYIKEHQVNDLLKIKECGGEAWFLINRRNRGRMECYAATPHLIEEMKKLKVKSVKWELLAKSTMAMPKVSHPNGTAWDLTPLMK